METMKALAYDYFGFQMGLLFKYRPTKFSKIRISVEKFKFSRILLGDKNATSLCSKNISTLVQIRE